MGKLFYFIQALSDMTHTYIHKKVVANVSRSECVYKRTGKQSVPFCERGRAAKRVTDFLQKKSEQA